MLSRSCRRPICRLPNRLNPHILSLDTLSNLDMALLPSHMDLIIISRFLPTPMDNTEVSLFLIRDMVTRLCIPTSFFLNFCLKHSTSKFIFLLENRILSFKSAIIKEMRIEVGHNNGQSGPSNRGPRPSFSHHRRYSSDHFSRRNGWRHHGKSNNDPASCLKCCVCFWVILPIILIIAGIIVIGSENYRVQRIEKCG